MKPFTLTPEQEAAVQAAPVDSPSLVVAGAGSGKTELMAVRVLWLVANGFARPEEILGLTFTRKAAAELSKRIYESLLKL
ncbi:MAG: UvrD-helicase domain-containing protein, partial [Rhodoluna sp.]|nr:UvrD-helicase domain-containing protein [Rhodoluna sp.]